MLDKLLRGRYKLIQVLSAGGFGQTYIAEDIDRPSHPQCVVKQLKPASTNPNFLSAAQRLFNREAETLEKLGNKHDQIPRLLAYFEEDQEFYLVQDFIEGQPLSTELPRDHRWSESKVIQLLQDVLKILEFIHGQGVIHRDLKPNNLIRRHEDGRLVLIDFGAVKQIRESVAADQMQINPTTISIGTRGYIPTEQVRGKPRPNSDIYALGMIGIQALTGLDPAQLQEDADGEVIWQYRTQASDELASILCKMVRYHFKDRYQSATEVLQALQALANLHASVQPASDKKQPSPEALSEAELQEAQVPLGIGQSEAEITSAVELREANVISDVGETGGKVMLEVGLPETRMALGIESPEAAKTPAVELRETKIFLDKGQPTDEAMLEIGLPETKMALGIESPEAARTPAVELRETKILLNPGQSTGEAMLEVGLPETKIALDIESSEAARTPVVELRETKILSNPGQSTDEAIVEVSLPETKIALDIEHNNQYPSNIEALQADNQLTASPKVEAKSHKHWKLLVAGLGTTVAVVAIATVVLVASKPPKQELLIAIGGLDYISLVGEKIVTNLPWDYSQLQDYLQQKDWEAADRETYEMMLKVAGSKSRLQGRFDLVEWQKFSCEDLKKIDRLWHDASGGKLGFSTQKKIFEEVQKNNVLFYDKIGWTIGNDLTVTWKYNPETKKAEYLPGKQPNFENPPDGHLPAKLEWETPEGASSKDWRFEKIYNCNV